MHAIRTIRRAAARRLRDALCRAGSVHRDQEGTISILSVFVMLVFTMLLMLLFNVAKQFDDKVRMQNAADAAAYSGGSVLARGLNVIAFSNHLEADVFAVTAFLREAQERNAEKYVPEILAKWMEMSSRFSAAQFPKFPPLAPAIAAKVPLEQQFVTAWSDMAAAAADNALPVFEYILGTPETENPQANDHLIPIFQRAVLQTTATLASDATNELALRHGLRQSDLQNLQRQMRDNPSFGAGTRGPQSGVLWRLSVEPVGWTDESDPMTRTLPIVDPDMYYGDYSRLPQAANYLDEARTRRANLALSYLDDWIRDRDPRRGLGFADEEARMSQFMGLYRTAACAQLDKLLNQDFPNTNVPMILRNFDQPPDLESAYMYVAVVYRRHVETMAPRFFHNPLDTTADGQTFAEVSLFIPRRRHVCCPWGWWHVRILPDGSTERYWVENMEGLSHEWSTFNQNWTAKLVPATAEVIPDILASNPGGPAAGVRTPTALRGRSMREFHPINTH
jgi:hypothetical protein